MPALTDGTPVIFRENSEHPQVAGIVTRVWANGKYVSLRTDDEQQRIFVRLIGEVRAPAEVTITPGDDTICARCECDLPAGAPAWPAGDGAVLCNDCAETEG